MDGYRMQPLTMILSILVMIALVMTAGCATSGDTKSTKDPLQGTWKQEALGIVITMELFNNGTGVMTTDTSAYGPGTPSSPAVTSTGVNWTRVSDTEYNLTINDVNGIFIYDKSSNCIYDSDSTRSRLRLYKQ
jgi:hypothetical protein